MPIRGESVGRAYITVIADGSSIPHDIEREFQNVDDVAETHGTKFAERWKQAFADELEKHDSDSLDNAFAKALTDESIANEFFNGSEWNRTKTRFNQEWGALGDAEAKSMEEHFRNAGSLEGIEEAISTSFGRIENDFRNTVSKNADEFTNHLRGARLESQRFRSEGDRDVHTFARMSESIGGIAENLGKAFGLGSRNNFLNFTGAFVQHSTELIGLPLQILGNLQELAGGFSAARADGEGLFKSFTSGFKTMATDAEGGETALSSFLSAGIVGVPILGAVLLGLVSVLSIVSALVAGIGAALISLVGSVAFGLVGLIAPLAGLLAPVAIAVVAVATGVLTLTKNKDRLAAFKKEITPITAALKELGNSTIAGFFNNLHSSLSGIGGELRKADPLFRSVGRAIAGLVNGLGRAFQTKEASNFFDVMSHFVPETITKLGKAVGNFSAAVGDIFVDLVPDARHFLNFLDRITGDFHTWVRENPEPIRRFFDRAEKSVEAIGRFLGPVVRLVGTLLDKGKGQGDDIFTSLGKQVDKLNDFIKKNPDGLTNFFKNGKQTADDIGTIARGLALMFAALNTPEGRKNLHNVLSLVGDLAGLTGPLSFLAGTVLPAVTGSLNPVGHVAGLVVGHFDDLKRAGKDVGRILGNAAGAIGNFFGSLGSGGGFGLLEIKPPSITWIPGVARAIGRLWDNISSGASGLAHDLANKAGEFGSAAASWSIRMLKQIAGLPGKIVGLFFGLGERIASAIGDIVLHIKLPAGAQSFLDKNKAIAGNIFHAKGGLFNKATLGIFGEAGTEALVPLTGPLSQVDPSVRELSAIARGLKSGGGSVTQQPGKTINVEQHITTVATDPRAAASEFLNHLTAVVA